MRCIGQLLAREQRVQVALGMLQRALDAIRRGVRFGQRRMLPLAFGLAMVADRRLAHPAGKIRAQVLLNQTEREFDAGRCPYRPGFGWADGAVGDQSTVRPIKTGYYQATLNRTEGAWKIVTQRIMSNLRTTFPAV